MCTNFTQITSVKGRINKGDEGGVLLHNAKDYSMFHNVCRKYSSLNNSSINSPGSK